MLTSTGRRFALLSVALYTAGVLLDHTLLIALALGFAALLVAAVGYVLPRQELEVVRELDPNRVTAGESALGLIRVRNRGGRKTPELTAFDRVGDGTIAISLKRLEPRSARREIYRLPTAKRGVYPVGPLVVERVDAFGLARREKHFGDEETLWVHPRRHRLRAHLPTPQRSLEGPTTDIAPRGTITFHALREYVAGDDLRHVHWRSSARLGQLMVRQYIDTSLPDVTVVLDTRLSAMDEDQFERAAEIAASVLSSWAIHDFPARLLTTCGTDLGGSGMPGGSAFLDRLASISPVDHGSFSGLDALLGRRDHVNAVVFIVGSVSDTDAHAIGLLARGFLNGVLVPCGSDPEPPSVPGLALLPGQSSLAFATAWNTGPHR